MVSNNKDGKSRAVNRRKFLTGLASGAAASVAGCTGGGDGSTPTPRVETRIVTEEGGTVIKTVEVTEQRDISDVSIQHWDIMAAQGQVVREAIMDLIARFEEDTGVNVTTNWSGYGPLYGEKWITQFKRDDYPVVYDTEFIAMGKMYATGKILPFSEWKQWLDPDVLENIQWMMPLVEEATRGWDEGPYDIPYGLNPRTPFVARTDHFEQAGLSIEDDFPPEDFNHLKSIARALQNDGPTDVGFPVYGDGFDTIDTFDAWRAADSEEFANYVNEDWTEPLYTSDPWVTNFDRMVSFEREGLATERSVSLSDEAARDLLAAGKVSLAQIEYFNVPVQFNRSRELLMDGTLRYGHTWPGDTGKPAITLPQSAGITRAPPGADEQEYRLKQRAGVEFLNRWFGEEFQKQLPRILGLWPVREDVWDEVELPGEEEHNIATSLEWMAERQALIQPTMINGSAVAYTIISNQAQQVFQGNKDVMEALEDAEEQALQVLQG